MGAKEGIVNLEDWPVSKVTACRPGFVDVLYRVNDRCEGELLVAKVLDVRITDVGAVEKEMVRSQPRPPIVAVAQSVLDIAQRGDLVL